eukprot:Rmarinus@m.3321
MEPNKGETEPLFISKEDLGRIKTEYAKAKRQENRKKNAAFDIFKSGGTTAADEITTVKGVGVRGKRDHGNTTGYSGLDGSWSVQIVRNSDEKAATDPSMQEELELRRLAAQGALPSWIKVPRRESKSEANEGENEGSEGSEGESEPAQSKQKPQRIDEVRSFSGWGSASANISVKGRTMETNTYGDFGVRSRVSTATAAAAADKTDTTTGGAAYSKWNGMTGEVKGIMAANKTEDRRKALQGMSRSRRDLRSLIDRSAMGTPQQMSVAPSEVDGSEYRQPTGTMTPSESGVSIAQSRHMQSHLAKRYEEVERREKEEDLKEQYRALKKKPPPSSKKILRVVDVRNTREKIKKKRLRMSDKELAEATIEEFIATDIVSLEERMWFVDYVGTMPAINQLFAEHDHDLLLSILDFLNSIFRGAGQVIFMNNPLSGIIILFALFFDSYWGALLGLIGVTVATAAAKALQLERSAIRNGLFGCNGLLVGLALASFNRSNQEVEELDPLTLDQGGEVDSSLIPVLLVLTIVSTVMMVAVGNFLVPVYGIPPLSLPFNFTMTMYFVACTLAFWYYPVDSHPDLLEPKLERGSNSELDWEEVATSILRSYSYIFFGRSLTSACMIIVAIIVCSPLSALMSVVGACASTIVALTFGLEPEYIYDGTYASNSLLVSIAIGGMFFVLTKPCFFITLLAVVITTITTAALQTLFSPVGVPVLQFPFCLVALMFIAVQAAAPNLAPIGLSTLTVPEDHLMRYRANQEVFHTLRELLKIMRSDRLHTMDREEEDDTIMMLQAEVRRLPKKELHRLERAFRYIDADGGGTIELSELRPIIQAVGYDMSEEELQELFKEADREKSGKIDLTGFAMIMLKRQHQNKMLRRLRQYFNLIDVDHSGTISVAELEQSMRNLGRPLSKADVSFLFNLFGDGTGHAEMTFPAFADVFMVHDNYKL